MNDKVAEFIANNHPGAWGAFAAVLLLREPGLLQRLLMAPAGMAMAYFGGEYVADLGHMPLDLARLLLGLFGMAGARWLMEEWRNLTVADLLRKLIAKWFGVTEEKKP